MDAPEHRLRIIVDNDEHMSWLEYAAFLFLAYFLVKWLLSDKGEQH